MDQQNKREKLPSSYFQGQEYIDDRQKTSMLLEVLFSTSVELEPFEFFYKKQKITGIQEGKYLKISFIQKLPRTLITDIALERRNAVKYIYGYLFVPMQRINQEMLRQRYSLGHFLVNTLSFFDIASVKLTNLDNPEVKEIININWKPIFSAPPYSHFGEIDNLKTPEVFVKDYIDAWNDFFKGDYDNCVRRLITSIENALTFYKLKKKNNKNSWWELITKMFKRGGQTSFQETVEYIFGQSDFIGHRVISDNLLFLYKVRNKITHGSLRIHQENGWWFCGKGLETLQYFYQFIDGGGEKSASAYIFRICQFGDLLFNETRGSTIEEIERRGEFMKTDSKEKEGVFIRTPEDMDNFKFNGLLISDNEKQKILKNKPRE